MLYFSYHFLHIGSCGLAGFGKHYGTVAAKINAIFIKNLGIVEVVGYDFADCHTFIVLHTLSCFDFHDIVKIHPIYNYMPDNV